MRTKRFLGLLLAFAAIFSLMAALSSEAKVQAKAKSEASGLSFGIYDWEADLFVLHKVKENETLKMFAGQTLICENWVADYEIIENDQEAVEVTLGGSRWYLKANNIGKATVKMLDPEGNNILTFNVEVVDADLLTSLTSNISEVQTSVRTYLKVDKKGKVKEYCELTVNNETSVSFKIAAITWNARRNNPQYKTVKSGKKTIKTTVATYKNIKSAKSNYTLTDKQIKSLKAGKAVVLQNDPPVVIAFNYSGMYTAVFR